MHCLQEKHHLLDQNVRLICAPAAYPTLCCQNYMVDGRAECTILRTMAIFRHAAGRQAAQRHAAYCREPPKCCGSCILSGLLFCCRNPGEAGSDDDTSPRSRAMSKYLSGRQHSGAITGPTESQTGISEKSTAQPAVQDTPLKQSQDPAAVLDDSSPPRVSGHTGCHSIGNVLT